MSRLLALAILFVVVLYGAIKIYPLVAGPSILVSNFGSVPDRSPHELVISGATKHTENLYLNGTLLPIDGSGHFSKNLTLPSGGAILSLMAVDRFGSETALTRSVFIPD